MEFGFRCGLWVADPVAGQQGAQGQIQQRTGLVRPPPFSAGHRPVMGKKCLENQCPRRQEGRRGRDWYLPAGLPGDRARPWS